MIPNGLVQVKEERPAQATGIGQANSRPVDVLDPGRVVRGSSFPRVRQVPYGSHRRADRGQGGAKFSSLKARISVRRHSSSRAVGQAKAWNRAKASRRWSVSQEGSSRCRGTIETSIP